MNKDQLRYFAILYRERNISRAARQVPMSKQGLGKSIHALEQELDVDLFEIGANGKRIPTAYADVLATFVQRVAVEYDKVMCEFSHIRTSQAKRDLSDTH